MRVVVVGNVSLLLSFLFFFHYLSALVSDNRGVSSVRGFGTRESWKNRRRALKRDACSAEQQASAEDSEQIKRGKSILFIRGHGNPLSRNENRRAAWRLDCLEKLSNAFHCSCPLQLDRWGWTTTDRHWIPPTHRHSRLSLCRCGNVRLYTPIRSSLRLSRTQK